MGILQALIALFVISIIVTAFINIKLSVALYISYLILIPYMSINIGGIGVSYNFVNLVLLFGFLIRNKHRKSTIVLNPYLVLMIGFLLLIPLQNLSIEYQLHNWISSFFRIFTIAFVSWNLIINEKDTIKYFKVALIISMVIVLVYGLVLTQLHGLNPYVSLVQSSLGINDMIKEAVEGRAFSYGYSSSTFNHAMAFGIFLLACFYYLVSLLNSKSKNNWFFLILLILVLLNMVFCGVRSVIVSLFVSLAYYLFNVRKIRLLLIVAVVASIGYIIIINNDVLSAHFSSMSIHNTDSMKGSSIDARLMQLKGCFDEINNSILIGKGYNWHAYYIDHYGIHPTILAFESIIFVALCNGGLLGILLWFIFIALTFKINKRYLKKEQYLLLNSMLVAYIVYVSLTGDYGYLIFYFILYSITFGTFYFDNIKSSCLSKNM